MKAIRKICPRCGEEKTSRTDVKDIYSYTEEIVHEKCPKCKRKPDTAEDKLLKAIFGESND